MGVRPGVVGASSNTLLHWGRQSADDIFNFPRIQFMYFDWNFLVRFDRQLIIIGLFEGDKPLSKPLITWFIDEYIDDLVQDCSNSIANTNTLELLQSCTKPSICAIRSQSELMEFGVEAFKRWLIILGGRGGLCGVKGNGTESKITASEIIYPVFWGPTECLHWFQEMPRLHSNSSDNSVGSHTHVPEWNLCHIHSFH